MFANSDELLKYIKDESVEMVDVRFCDCLLYTSDAADE